MWKEVKDERKTIESMVDTKKKRAINDRSRIGHPIIRKLITVLKYVGPRQGPIQQEAVSLDVQEK